MGPDRLPVVSDPSGPVSGEVASLRPALAASEARADQLAGLVEGLLVRITELEAALNKDSKNSSKPPSKDGLSKRKRAKPPHSSGGR
nr:DUF6444 domain-containing protein [Streptomyces sp. NRRL F-5053]